MGIDVPDQEQSGDEDALLAEDDASRPRGAVIIAVHHERAATR